MKKILAILLSVVMVVGVSMPAMAETTEQILDEIEITEQVSEDTEIVTGSLETDTEYGSQLEGTLTSGTCGPNVTWQITGNSDGYTKQSAVGYDSAHLVNTTNINALLAGKYS